MESLRIFTPEGVPPDEGAIAQMHTCMEDYALGGVLCADHHLGYSAPIGAALAYPEHISPSGVGYDIGCGNKAVATSIFYPDIRQDLPRIMDEISQRISFGMGRNNAKEADHAVIDEIAQAPHSGQRNLLSLARRQLGTVGGGNHYVDLFREEGTDRVWVGVHFGSRGFGHKTASGFLSLAQGGDFDEHPSEGEMHSPPVLLHTGGALGYLYIEAMSIAGRYAYAGRDVVVNEVLDILGLGQSDIFDEVHNHHNFAWREATPLGSAWVVRKGSTPLWPGQRGFVGGSMGENAVIIKGRDTHTGAEALWSAPHGAGRAMSRNEAKGKSRKRRHCQACGWTQQPGTPRPEAECPSCHVRHKLVSKWVQEQPGKVDWHAALSDLEVKGIHLRGGAADEAPMAYKRLPAVLEAHRGHIEITHQLRPIGVAMAGPNVRDLYKD